ncbi:hypothetical protein [Pseudobacteriovorax antillogorgiicola]|uniref:Uncharacterized protein n=1 Tax=Pseudobacteriovorax antillogorgiicola TaxID=1513793 RepID=A0A1Y6BXH1_9BACT|nr:hypothetical protein [Pseudobacteriovorax antillogorgiicola]TCS50341.1 hypothetical protein EDD56_113160 [Pseudobacteriovorax antillogorgiicola]SMF34760.1 hypothetical protein SAMN06296036_110159 [Pseudobacteriovorax antillogorgiicola]
MRQALKLVHHEKSSQINLETERAKFAAAQTWNLKLAYKQRKGELVNVVLDKSKMVRSFVFTCFQVVPTLALSAQPLR